MRRAYVCNMYYFFGLRSEVDADGEDEGGAADGGGEARDAGE